MNPKVTWFWTVMAAALFAFIFLFERQLHRPLPGPQSLLPNLVPADVTGVQILGKGQPTIELVRTNGNWEMVEPMRYPAQNISVEALLAVLTRLAPTSRIGPKELKDLRHTDQLYGFEPPQITLILQHGEDQTFIHLGYKTGPGDQLFVQIVGIGEVFVVDSTLLKLVPTDAASWRDTSLVNLNQFKFDRLVVTNAGKAPLELQRNPTNRLWRLILPGWEPRADSDKVEAALQRLQGLPIDRFVTDDSKADLDAYGLQTPDISLVFAKGTNTLMLLEFGKSPTNDTKQVYARRGDLASVVTVEADPLVSWRSPSDFRDRHLVTLTAPVDVIEVTGADHFSLLRVSTNSWRVKPAQGTGFDADPTLAEAFLTNLCNLQVAEFVKDVVTDPDLPARGLAKPFREISLQMVANHPVLGPTNVVMAQLDFGTNQDDEVFVRRADESALYTVKLSDYDRLPSASWQLRDRRIWDFGAADIVRLIIQQNTNSRSLLHRGTNSWSLEAPAQGMVNVLAVEEIAHRLGELSAWAWVERGIRNPAACGFSAQDYKLTVELKDGTKRTVEIGGPAASGFPFATTVLDGESWVFEFPPELYQLLQLYLPAVGTSP
jgi:hypothetical protein